MSKEKIDLDPYIKNILNDNSLSVHDKLIGLKNIMLEVFLYGFSNNKSFKDKNIVFYGGTALNRCIFENYRFSEDLDFGFEMMNLSTQEISEYIKDVRKDIEDTFDFKGAGLWQIFIKSILFAPGSIKLSFSDNYLTDIINNLIPLDNKIIKNFGKVLVDTQAYGGFILPPVNQDIKKIKYELLNLDSEILCKSTEDIISGKIKAFCSRQKDRDFYDVLKISELVDQKSFKKYIELSGVNQTELISKLSEFKIDKSELYSILLDSQYNDIDSFIQKTLPKALKKISYKEIILKNI